MENNSLSNVELDGNCVSSGGAKQEEIETRLKSLDERFTKVCDDGHPPALACSV